MSNLEVVDAQGDVFATSVAEAIREYLPSDGVFVDVGGHGGYYALIGARRTRIDGRVVVIEPVASNAAQIRAAMRRNGFGNVAIFEQAASDMTGRVGLQMASEQSEGLIASTVMPGDDVAAIALDDMAIDEGLDRLDVLVIDTGGHEFEIVEGAAMLLRTRRPVVLITIDRDREPELGELLGRSGYSTERLAERDDRVLIQAR